VGTERGHDLLPLAAAEPDDRVVVNAIPAQVWRPAPDGAIQYVNQQWMDYTGLSQEESQGWGWASRNVITLMTSLVF
jgi:PAS domain-containing protein